MTGELDRIETLLAAQIGLDPKSVGSRLILRAAQRRMSELGLADLSDYANRLYNTEHEVQSLAEQIVVPESWFFRDAGPYKWLRTYIRSGWLDQPARSRVRVLSLACAGGEEPYSIAIIMSEIGLPAGRFSIDAVDISARRLALARRGVYSANAFRGCDPSRRLRFFREHPGGFELDPAIRSTVRFSEANVLDSRLLEKFSAYDVIFCRNLLIYLHAAARAAVTSILDQLLASDGRLVIGHADRFEWNGSEPKFTAIGEPGCFVYCKTGTDLGCGPEPKREQPQEMASSITTVTSVPTPALWDPKLWVVAATAPTPDTTPLTVPATNRGLLLDEAALLANERRYCEAIAACQRDVALRGPSARAYYLLGVIHQSQSDLRQAETCFHKAIYLDPNHDEALLALALLAEQRGQHQAARSYRRRAARIVTATRNKAT
jgi:chemotaxis protein methyltransferase WspC